MPRSPPVDLSFKRRIRERAKLAVYLWCHTMLPLAIASTLKVLTNLFPVHAARGPLLIWGLGALVAVSWGCSMLSLTSALTRLADHTPYPSPRTYGR